MNEPAISFRDLLAYTDYLSQRWLSYFRQNPAALEVNAGGKTGSLRDLVTHIYQVEQFFANLLVQEGAGSMRPPAQIQALEVEDLERMHQEAHENLTRYLGSAGEERLQKTRTLGPRSEERRVGKECRS